jgi:hypothetical protein
LESFFLRSAAPPGHRPERRKPLRHIPKWDTVRVRKEFSGGQVVSDEYLDRLNEQLNALSALVAETVEEMSRRKDDRVTILGMVHSAVMHGLHDAGFTDDTE